MISIMAYFVSYQLLVCSPDSRKNAFYFNIKYISVIIYIFELTKDINNYYKNAYMMQKYVYNILEAMYIFIKQELYEI